MEQVNQQWNALGGSTHTGDGMEETFNWVLEHGRLIRNTGIMKSAASAECAQENENVG